MYNGQMGLREPLVGIDYTSKASPKIIPLVIKDEDTGIPILKVLEDRTMEINMKVSEEMRKEAFDALAGYVLDLLKEGK